MFKVQKYTKEYLKKSTQEILAKVCRGTKVELVHNIDLEDGYFFLS
jgi:hypothetical protein